MSRFEAPLDAALECARPLVTTSTVLASDRQHSASPPLGDPMPRR